MWRCKNCHSTGVEGLGWIDLNAQHRVDDVEEQQEYWCNSCDARTEVYYKNEPDEENIVDDDEDLYSLYPDDLVPNSDY